jgi:hypothetical protein
MSENIKFIPQHVVQEALTLKSKKKGAVQYLMDQLYLSKKDAWKVMKSIIWAYTSNADLSTITYTPYTPTVIDTDTQGGNYDHAPAEALTTPMLDNFPIEPKIIEPASKIEESKSGWYFNKDTDTYIVPLKSVSTTPLSIPRWKHEAILRAYSNWKGDAASMVEICKTFDFTKTSFEEYKRLFKMTHDMFPVSPETLEREDSNSIVNNLLTTKMCQIQQAFNKADWELTQKDAFKWREFKALAYDPIENMLSKFKPDPIEPTNFRDKGTRFIENAATGEKVMLIGLNDTHFGSGVEKDKLYKGKEYSTDICIQQVEDYADRIGQDVDNRNYLFSKAIVCVVGDILHTLTGFTARGTQIDYDIIGEDQFEAALNSCMRFLVRMLEIFPEVEVQAVKGNHAGMDEYMLFRAIEMYFTKEPRIKFNVSKARTLSFKVLNTFCILDHGDSDSVRAKVPTSGLKRDNYIQALLLADPAKLVGVKSKIFIQGDLHHNEFVEHNGFEFYMFGTMVTGDRYANQLNLRGRPRQSALVIDNNGVKEQLHFYFD